MCAKDNNACQILTKQEQPLSDFPDLLKLQEKNKMPGIKECYRNDRATANFTDYTTESSLTEEERVYVLFLLCGKPMLKFLSIKVAYNANAEGIHSCIKEAFERVRKLDLSKKLLL